LGKKIFLIQAEGLGRGEDKLGGLLMANFLRLLGENKEKPESLVFWNAGVRLVCDRFQSSGPPETARSTRCHHSSLHYLS
jgi:hypothetical protein